MIRKVSPSIVLPLALRAVGSNSKTLSGTIYASRYSHTISSIVASAEDVNATLYKLLKKEIESLKFNLKNTQVNTAPDSFPFKICNLFIRGYTQTRFNIHRCLSLRREFPNGEEVVVEIQMRSIEFSNADDICEYDKEPKKDIKAPVIPMTVTVKMPRDSDKICRKSLEFVITVSTEDIIIQRFTIDNYRENFTHLTLPKFKELDYVLQQWLYKYLEVRGISTKMASYLLNVIARENQKSDLGDLNALKNFTSSPDAFYAT